MLDLVSGAVCVQLLCMADIHSDGQRFQFVLRRSIMEIKTITKNDLESFLKRTIAIWSICTIAMSIVQLSGWYFLNVWDFECYILSIFLLYAVATMLMLIVIGKYICQEDRADDNSGSV